MAQQTGVYVDSKGIEEVSVEVFVADETAESDTREHGEVFGGNGDGKGQREDPAEGR
jgi:hypothetical protein